MVAITGGRLFFIKYLLINYEQKDWKVVSTEFDFIEPDKKKNYRKEKLVISSGRYHNGIHNK